MDHLAKQKNTGNENFDLTKLIGKKELDAYKTYVALTSYENVFLNNPDLRGRIEEYSTRDATFPLDFAVGA
jgi:hypothetical protein